MAVDSLDRHEAHGGLARSDGNGQCIVAVVLAALAKGADELGGDQPHDMTAGGEGPPPVMCAAAGFHGHGARCQRGRPALEGGSPQHLALEHRSTRIEHAHGERVLGQSIPTVVICFMTSPPASD